MKGEAPSGRAQNSKLSFSASPKTQNSVRSADPKLKTQNSSQEPTVNSAHERRAGTGVVRCRWLVPTATPVEYAVVHDITLWL